MSKSVRGQHINRFGRKVSGAILKLGVMTAMLAMIIPMTTTQSWAGCSSCCGENTASARVLSHHNDGRDEIKGYVGDEITKQQKYLANTFYRTMVLPALQQFTRQMSAVAAHQALTIGTFFDAKQQLETQRLQQELQVQAHKDYQPSKGMCTFGTNVRSLAASESVTNFNKLALGSRQIKRHMGSATMASRSNQLDKSARWVQFQNNYCDVYDNAWLKEDSDNSGLSLACGAAAKNKTPEQKERMNIDIDYTRLIDQPRTLDVAFYDDTLQPAEEDVIALGNNLFGHNVITRAIAGQDLSDRNFENQKVYMELRSLAAKRNVAENSYNAIVALKSAGSHAGSSESVQTRQFLAAVMKDLGVAEAPNGSDADIYKIIGDDPSYYAQLEILAKKIYQSPNFFASLYDKPANVERKSVALKAIEMMLDRAIYESQMRQEMVTSVLLSAEIKPDFKTAKSRLEK